jgi:soluble lytic murein transglycosylase-like protein
MMMLGLLLTMISPSLVAADQTIPVTNYNLDLPKPLSDGDVERYQRIFDLQQDKKWEDADRLINELDNDLLMGRVLSQRYLHPDSGPAGWRSTYKELRLWLEDYNDHPAASRIYRLSNRRRPGNAKSQKQPKKDYLNGYGWSSLRGIYVKIPTTTQGRKSPKTTRKIARTVRSRIRSGWPTGALKVLTKSNLRYLTEYEEAVLRADIAHGYFIYGKDQKAITQARQAIGISGIKVPQAYWTAGISAWRSGDVPLALNFLHVLAEHEDAPPSLVTSAAFWASRGELSHGSAENSFRYLEIAARHQDTFYGALASEALGQDITLDFDLPPVTDNFIDWMKNQKGGMRAFALLQVDDAYHASREIRYLWEAMNEDQRRQAMSLSAQTHMAGLSFRTAAILREETGVSHYGALYPIPDFETSHPIRVDQALLLAVMRQESGFNPRAESRAKASGLMQLMPATAAFITRDRKYRSSARHDLLIPEINIRIGEDYILHLLEEDLIDQDLVKLLAAYNGGPGNLNKWMGKVNHGGDTLMLLESLPSRETRFYVKNVMTNLWIYRKRFSQNAMTVASLAGIGHASYSPFAEQNGLQTCELVKLSEQCRLP